MSDALLPYYERELDAIKRLAAEFADTHPKIAGRLRLSADAVDDPHVARLLEGVAFLAARVHHRLDDEFPELTDALLGLLYPHYLAPMPSCMVAQFDCQPDLMNPARLPAGHRRSTPNRCTARNCATAPPHPSRCGRSRWRTSASPACRSWRPPTRPPPAPTGVLRITLKCASPEVTFTQLGVDRLRFFLRGPTNQALALYELLGAHAISIAYADNAVDPAPVIVPASAIEPVGFSPDEALLPWSARGFSGFRLLTEYFAFPEKFLFLDITRMDAKTLVSAGNRLEIFVYLDRSLPELERTIGQQSLALGCTPLVNLFPQRCEPVTLSHQDTEYRVVPDARRPRAAEIWSVERVRETLPDGSFRPWRPFHRLTEGDPGARHPGRLLPSWRAAPPHRACRAPRCSSRRTTPTSTRTSRPRRCSRSTRCASTATCRPTCRSAAATRACAWSRAPPPSPR